MWSSWCIMAWRCCGCCMKECQNPNPYINSIYTLWTRNKTNPIMSVDVTLRTILLITWGLYSASTQSFQMTQSSIFSNVCLQVVVPVALSVSFFLSSDLKKIRLYFMWGPSVSQLRLIGYKYLSRAMWSDRCIMAWCCCGRWDKGCENPYRNPYIYIFKKKRRF